MTLLRRADIFRREIKVGAEGGTIANNGGRSKGNLLEQETVLAEAFTPDMPSTGIPWPQTSKKLIQ